MLDRELCKVKLTALSALVLRDFIDRRTEAGAGGVTIAADLSFLSAVLKWGRHALLFPYQEASISAAFARACKQLGIKDLRFHDLRHRATAEFFRMGLDIPRVALLTGHRTWGMLRRYTSIKPSDVHAAIKKPASPAPD